MDLSPGRTHVHRREEGGRGEGEGEGEGEGKDGQLLPYYSFVQHALPHTRVCAWSVSTFLFSYVTVFLSSFSYVCLRSCLAAYKRNKRRVMWSLLCACR
jgi:hypothetical protein